MNRLLRILNVLAFLLFLGFAGVQYNDPDGYIWIMIYGYVALLAVFTTFHIKTKLGAILGMVMYSVLFIKIYPENATTLTSWYELEQGREAGGLALCAIWCAIMTLQNFNRKIQRAQ